MDAALGIRELVRGAEGGQAAAAEQLFATLYHELHRLAAVQLARNGAGVSLGTTTLLHEVYLSMAGRELAAFPDRARFMGYAARAMRGLIIDYARRARAQKRGGGVFEITLEAADTPAVLPLTADDEPVELDRLSDALDELATVEPALAQLVDLHFFCGFSLAEIAVMRCVSARTTQRDWGKARLYLREALRQRLR